MGGRAAAGAAKGSGALRHIHCQKYPVSCAGAFGPELHGESFR